MGIIYNTISLNYDLLSKNEISAFHIDIFNTLNVSLTIISYSYSLIFV